MELRYYGPPIPYKSDCTTNSWVAHIYAREQATMCLGAYSAMRAPPLEQRRRFTGLGLDKAQGIETDDSLCCGQHSG